MYNGTTQCSRQTDGHRPKTSTCRRTIAIGKAKPSAQFFKTRVAIPSGPVALSTFNLHKIRRTSFVLMGKKVSVPNNVAFKSGYSFVEAAGKVDLSANVCASNSALSTGDRAQLPVELFKGCTLEDFVRFPDNTFANRHQPRVELGNS